MDGHNVYIIDLSQPLRTAEVLEWQLDRSFWSSIESAEIEDGMVDVRVTITPVREYFEVNWDLSGSVVVPCDRCLDPLTLEVNVTETMTIELGDALVDDDDKVLILDARTPTYDVRDLLYSLVVLSLPLQRAHDLSECNPDMLSHLVDVDPEAPLREEQQG